MCSLCVNVYIQKNKCMRIEVLPLLIKFAITNHGFINGYSVTVVLKLIDKTIFDPDVPRNHQQVDN